LLFKTICVVSFGLEKTPQKYPEQLYHFSRVGDDFSFEKKIPLNKKLI